MKTKLFDYLNEETSDEAFKELEEQNAVGGGAIVGYTSPLGATGIGTNKQLEKGFWRDKAGKAVKSASPKLHKKRKKNDPLFEFETTTDRGMARLWADQPDITNAEQPVKSSSPELDKDIEKIKAS
jgi:hypothetical protein